MAQLAEKLDRQGDHKSPALASSLAKAEPTRALSEKGEASVLIGDDGQTIIHHDVVAKIAGTAVREVKGVHELVPFGAGPTMSHLAQRMTGSTMRDLGINVEVGKVEAAVDVRIITEYGQSIVDIAHAIRENTKKRVLAMTGLQVMEVNIEVLDLHFPEDSPTSAPSPPSQERVR